MIKIRVVDITSTKFSEFPFAKEINFAYCSQPSAEVARL